MPICSGVPYPIHPIDAVIADIGDNGTVSCYAAWEAQDKGRTFLRFKYLGLSLTY